MKTVRPKRNNVIAFVPAHNEENIIRSTIESILTQTVNVDVLVISDNSTDNTVSIVRSIAATDNRVSLIETVGNKFKKSGALNAAYQNVDLNSYDYVLSVDGDTVIAPDLVEQALIEFQLDPLLGAVCSRAGVVKQKTNGFFEKLVYHWQYVEYAEFDRSRVSQDRGIKVAHGMCTVYKVDAIKAVMARRIDTGKLDCVYIDTGKLDCVYTLRYVQNPGKWEYLVRITFIPQIFYAWFTIAQLVYAHYLFLFKSGQEW